jgi:hypothetical protein
VTDLDAFRRRATCLVAACVVAAMWHISGAAQSQFWPRSVGPFITIAWDPSPDPSVMGYIVYVGTESRKYAAAFDVGTRTSFVYPYAAGNRRHFFAVASYSSALGVGTSSDEVSGFGRLVPAAGVPVDLNITPFGSGGVSSHCVSGGAGCLAAATVSAAAGRISALTASAKGQVWFVEDKQRIFTIDVNGAINRIERRSAASRGQVEGLAIDPRFDETHHVYVQEIGHLRDGSRELTISRFREVMRTLRERAVIVSGIRLPPSGSAPFAVDGEGRIFVAVPRDRGGPRPHEGVVFAVQPDGTYVKGPSGSPVAWRGLSDPSSLVWDAAGRELWLAGADAAGTAMAERLPMSAQPQPQWQTADDPNRYLLFPAPGGRLLRIDRHADRAESVSLGTGENVTAVTGSGHDVVFAVTQSDTASGSRIVVIPVTD